MKTKIKIEDLEKIADGTIEDMKHLFSFRVINGGSSKYLYINEHKIGQLRYLFIKNAQQVLGDGNG
jgi:hypothetical protein